MKLHSVSSATPSRHSAMSRSIPVRLGAFALAIVFTATQTPAQGASTANAQAGAQQGAATGESTGQAQTTYATATIATDSAPGAMETATTAVLPDAPAAAAPQSESASLSMPPEMKAMMDDASQAAQSLQSTPSTTNHKLVQRPGMLVLGIAGVPLIVLGTMIFSLNVGSSGKANGLRNGLGTAFLAPGAAMAGFGFYFAFHKKNR